MYNFGSFIQSCSLRKQDISYFSPSSRFTKTTILRFDQQITLLANNNSITRIGEVFKFQSIRIARLLPWLISDLNESHKPFGWPPRTPLWKVTCIWFSSFYLEVQQTQSNNKTQHGHLDYLI